MNSCNFVRKRGFLGVMSPLSIAVGVLVAYICGALFEYDTVPYCIIGFPVLFLIVMGIIPDTPHTLIRQKKLQASCEYCRFTKIFTIPSYYRKLNNRWNFITMEIAPQIVDTTLKKNWLNSNYLSTKKMTRRKNIRTPWFVCVP